MTTRKIDTLVMVIADRNGGKSNQMRSIFEEFELRYRYGGYPTSRKIAYKYSVHPNIDLYIRLSSWHEKGKNYADVERDIASGYLDPRNRYKVFVPAQVSPTDDLMSGEELFIQLHSDFDIRRSFAVWLHPDASNRRPFSIGAGLASFMATHRHVTALAIDALALHPSAAPITNSINARLLCDFLFRV